MIPFIRNFPNGRRALQQVARHPDIEAKATHFISFGGQFHIAIEEDGDVTLTANLPKDRLPLTCGISTAERENVETETSFNGPELLDAVDRIVTNSEKHLATAQ